jgi:iron(III) transport system substrate-binding protein
MERRKLSRRDILQGSVALAAGTVFASPVRAQAPEPVAITPALVEAAKKEGKLIFYSSMDLPVGEKLGKAFEAAFPGITIQIERSGSERLFQRIDQEFARPRASGCRRSPTTPTSSSRRMRQKALPICSIPNGRARW